MLRLILVAIVAILVSEINKIYAEPTEAPETEQDIRSYDTDRKRGCWTEWYDRDNPSGSGDWETLKDLRKENPGKICRKPSHIHAQTLNGQKAPAAGDEDVLISPSVGLICKNKDQKDKKCEDYKVRFRCFPPYCAGHKDLRRIPIGQVCWTKWFDRDDPSGTGDWELLKDLRKENSGQICEKPRDMEVLTTGSPPTAAGNTGQNFYQNHPHKGFVCRNKDQKGPRGCYDYKVRFSCPCHHLHH